MPCVYLRKKIEVFPIQHSTISFYKGGDRCLLCGTDWVFKQNGLDDVFKWLIIHFL